MIEKLEELLPSRAIVLVVGSHQEICRWAMPVSDSGCIGVMLRKDSKALDLIEAGALRVGVNRFKSVPDDIPLPVHPDNALVIQSADVAAICRPEFAFRPDDDYSHVFATMRILEDICRKN